MLLAKIANIAKFFVTYPSSVILHANEFLVDGGQVIYIRSHLLDENLDVYSQDLETVSI